MDNPPADLLAGLGLESAVEVREGRDYLVVLADRQQVEAVQTDMARLQKLGKMICVSAPDEGMTLSAASSARVKGAGRSGHRLRPQHADPWWGEKLGKTTMMARQVSARGGDLALPVAGRQGADLAARPPPICANQFTCEGNIVFTPGGILYRADGF